MALRAALALLPAGAAAAADVRQYASPAAYAAARARAAAAGAPGTYAKYDWPSGVPLTPDMQVDHAWTTIPKGTDTDGNGVFASSQYWYKGEGVKAAGYMGSQVMRRGDGTERRVFIFSCWDNDPDHRAMWTTDATCSRFGGEGVGSHCILDYPVKEGVRYRFKVALSGSNASGAFWTGTVTEPSGASATVGTLYYPNVGSNTGFGTLQSTSNLFLEYFAGGDCDGAATTAVGVFGPYFHDRSVTPTMAYPAYGDGGCERTEVTACVPGHGCGAPRVLLQGGRGVVRNNTNAARLWADSPAPAPPAPHGSCALLRAGHECGAQTANLGDGLATPDDCAAAARTNAACRGYFMYSKSYWSAWGCRCCATDAAGGANVNWDMYQYA